MFCRKKKAFLWIFSLILSCSYIIKEPRNPPKINGVPIKDEDRLIYVQNFQNDSYASGIHTVLTEYIKRDVNRRGRFIQTRNKNEANYFLYGEIIHYQITGNLLDQGGEHISSNMMIVAKIEIQKKGGLKLQLERDEIPARTVFSTQIGIRESEIQAQNRLLNILSSKIVDTCERGWYYSLGGKI